jgi:hypothetical protein
MTKGETEVRALIFKAVRVLGLGRRILALLSGGQVERKGGHHDAGLGGEGESESGSQLAMKQPLP